jgi:hypothetical protein
VEAVGCMDVYEGQCELEGNVAGSRRDEHVVSHRFVFMTSKSVPTVNVLVEIGSESVLPRVALPAGRARRCTSKRAENVSCATQQVGRLVYAGHSREHPKYDCVQHCEGLSTSATSGLMYARPKEGTTINSPTGGVRGYTQRDVRGQQPILEAALREGNIATRW